MSCSVLAHVPFIKVRGRSLYDLAHCLASKGLFMELSYSSNDPENQATLEIKLYDNRLVFKITNLPIGPRHITKQNFYLLTFRCLGDFFFKGKVKK